MRAEAGATGLPAQLTTFVGRGRELDAITALLEANRLVTVAGAGGCGKTRLAVEVATRAAVTTPVRFVDLAPIGDPADLPAAFAAALDVKDRRSGSIVDAIVAALDDTDELLLVVDNCEHVIDAAAHAIADLLGRCPPIRVLATSRERLGVPGEVTVRVPSLAASESHELFVARARNARPDFAVGAADRAVVDGICHQLDGIPLAIELAAARTSTLSPRQIADELGDSLRLLTTGARTAVPRHQTLRASIEWSVRLLDEPEQVLLRRLAVFAGGFTLDAATSVAGGRPLTEPAVLDLLAALVDRSLVHAEPDAVDAGRFRYRLLETIRQYADEQLDESGDRSSTIERHRRHFRSLLAAADAHAEGPDQARWRARVAAELDNLRAAFRAARDGGHHGELLDLVCATGNTLSILGRYAEQRQWLQLALELAPPSSPHRAQALYQLGNAMLLTDAGGAVPLLREARERALASGDRTTAFWVLPELAGGLAATGDFDGAMGHYDEADALAVQLDDRIASTYATFHRGNTLLWSGHFAAARRCLQDAVAAGTTVDHHERWALAALGTVLGFQGRLDEAAVTLEPVLAATPDDDAMTWSVGVCGLALARAHAGRTDEALRLLAERAIPPAIEVGLAYWPQLCVGISLLLDGRSDEARTALGDALTKALAFSPQTAMQVRCALADAELASGRLDRAVALVDDTIALGAEVDAPAFTAAARTLRAVTSLLAGDLDRAEADAHAALTAHLVEDAVGGVIETLEVLGALGVRRGRAADAARSLGAASSLRRSQGYLRRPPHDAVWFEAAVAAAGTDLGDEAFAAAWSSGEALAMEEAVAFASRGRGPRAARALDGGTPLTAAEQRVATLVAQGLTNPQIGERLFISRHTVDSHLRHIFSKLGVASRAEVAAHVTRNGVDA